MVTYIDRGKDLFSIHDGKDSIRSYQSISSALSLFGYCEHSKAAQIYCPHTFTRQSSFSSEYFYRLNDTNTDLLSLCQDSTSVYYNRYPHIIGTHIRTYATSMYVSIDYVRILCSSTETNWAYNTLSTGTQLHKILLHGKPLPFSSINSMSNLTEASTPFVEILLPLCSH